jgi:hypothetical protein
MSFYGKGFQLKFKGIRFRHSMKVFLLIYVSVVILSIAKLLRVLTEYEITRSRMKKSAGQWQNDIDLALTLDGVYYVDLLLIASFVKKEAQHTDSNFCGRSIVG